MEYLPKNPILEYNETTFEDIRKKYNLDKPGRMKEAVDILDKWVKEQKHFLNKDFSPRYLENTILPCKGSLERSKRRIDRMCTFRTLFPQYFGEYDLRQDFKEMQEGITYAYLPKLTPEHHRIALGKITGDKWYSNLMLQLTRSAVMFGEYLKIHECCNGYILIADYRDLNILEHVKNVNLLDLKNSLAIVMDGIGVRVIAIHMVTSSKYIEVIVNLLKSVLSPKLANRIQVHTSLDTVYDSVPKDLLPVEYGGKEKPLKEIQEQWFDVLEGKEYKEHLKKMNASGTDETLRNTNIFNEEYLGMPGTFRTLSVD